METFAILGFTFGMFGFVFALNAGEGIKKLKQELETLRRKVQALEDGGKEA